MPISKKRTWLLAVTSASVLVPACSSEGGSGNTFVGDVATPVDGGEAVGQRPNPLDGGPTGPFGVIAHPVDGGDGGDAGDGGDGGDGG